MFRRGDVVGDAVVAGAVVVTAVGGVTTAVVLSVGVVVVVVVGVVVVVVGVVATGVVATVAGLAVGVVLVDVGVVVGPPPPQPANASMHAVMMVVREELDKANFAMRIQSKDWLQSTLLVTQQEADIKPGHLGKVASIKEEKQPNYLLQHRALGENSAHSMQELLVCIVGRGVNRCCEFRHIVM